MEERLSAGNAGRGISRGEYESLKANGITSGYVLGGAGLISDGFAKTIFQVTESLK